MPSSFFYKVLEVSLSTFGAPIPCLPVYDVVDSIFNSFQCYRADYPVYILQGQYVLLYGSLVIF